MKNVLEKKTYLIGISFACFKIVIAYTILDESLPACWLACRGIKSGCVPILFGTMFEGEDL